MPIKENIYDKVPHKIVWSDPARVQIRVNGNPVWITIDQHVAADNCRVIKERGVITLYGCVNQSKTRSIYL